MLGKAQWKLRPQSCKEHPDENCSILCIDDDCSNKGLICAECQIFTHNKHVSKPIAIALQQIARDLQPIPAGLHYIVRLDSLRLKFQGLVGRLGKERREVNAEVSRFFTILQEKITDYRVLCSKILAQESVSPDFWRLVQKYKFFNRQEEDKQRSNFQLFMREIVKQIQQRCEQFEEAISKRSDTHELLRVLAPLQSENRVNYLFSATHHHANITVTPDALTATQLNNYSTNFAFIQPLVQGKRSLRSKKSIKIQINKLTSWLSIGAAYLSFASKGSYYFSTGVMGHGAFMMSYNGYSWHHSDSNLNSVSAAFTYAQNDIVTITIQPNASKIVFEREGTAAYELPYDRLPDEELYFCVSLSSHEQSVTIVK